jgi:four helix bundle protein
MYRPRDSGVGEKKMGIHSETELNRKFIEFAKLLNIYLNHFPKHEKYALANQIRRTAYEVYDLISEGQKKYYKKTTLTDLDIKHEKLRMQLHLANELGYFQFSDGRPVLYGHENPAEHRYLTINLMVDELGRMIGGWIQKLRTDNRW